MGIKGHSRIYMLAAVFAAASIGASAAPTPAPAPATMPPLGGYEREGANSDDLGKFWVDMRSFTSPTQLWDKPVEWVRITRFKSENDPKSGYPAEYLKLEADCHSWTYVISAKFLLDADGRDLNPDTHVPKHPALHKILNTQTGVYNDPTLSAPELMAVRSLDQDCTEPD